MISFSEYLTESKNSGNKQIISIYDFAAEKNELKQHLKNIEKKFKLKTKVLNINGPGGGATAAILRGTYDNMKKFHADYANGDKHIMDEFEDYIVG